MSKKHEITTFIIFCASKVKLAMNGSVVPNLYLMFYQTSL